MSAPSHHEVTIRDLAQAFYRRRAVFLWVVSLCLLCAAIVCIVSPKQYQATGMIELQSPMGDGLDRQSLMGDAPAASDPLSEDITMQTQAKVLQSDTLALRTIATLSATDQGNLLGTSRVRRMMQGLRKLATRDSEQIEVRRLKAFHRNLFVKPIGGTRLLQIAYLSGDPNTAAAVVNGLVQQLVLFGEETRLQSTDQAARGLSKELDGLRARSKKLQQRVAALQSQTGMYDEGTTDSQGRAQAYSAILEQFQRAAATLSDATQNKILKEAIYEVARTGNAELVSSLAGNTATGAASSNVTNSLITVQNLRVTEGQMQEQLDQLRVKFGSGYPKVAELQAGIAGIEQSIHDETERITGRAKNDAAVADRTWVNAQHNYDRLKANADALNSKTMDYRMMQQEADDSRTLYTDLMKRLNEAGILQGLSSNKVGIVDVARVPKLPAKPAIPVDLAFGLVFGLFAGALGVAIVELLDDTITEFSTVEAMGLRVSGIVPLNIACTNKDGSNASMARYNDAIRSIRSNLIRSSRDVESTVVVVSPVTPERSARRFAASLSRDASRAGYRVLLVEANLREATAIERDPIHPVLNKLEPNSPKHNQGMLSGYLLTPGDTDHMSSPMLELDRMHKLVEEWRSKFDMVVIDSPAVLFQPDAAVLGKEADVNVQVVTYGVTTTNALQRTRDLLKGYYTEHVAVVIEDVPVNSVGYRNYYGSSGSRVYPEELIA